ncbi:DNA polymerase [Bacillus sp. 7894-2]|uniref:DNA polymerase n=1 Tax=Bacillus sp. 7894-2 TaxID=2021695 RepID=UPI000BA655C5|nr:DNA polymerase [Bacillus sp. 7894-2]PAE24028.1 DNA polymerase I [Bacillus sp. 7894-2]
MGKRIKIGEIKLKGDVSDAGNEGKQRAREAESRKRSNDETLEEAWARIKASKAYTGGGPKQQRLTEVYEALQSGDIGREPVKPGKKQGKLSAAEMDRLYEQLRERKREETLTNMVKNMPANYFLITAEAQLDEVCSDWSREPIVAIDTETTGVDVYSDVIVGISITFPTISVVPLAEIGKHVYIPVAHNVEGPQLKRDYVLKRLRPFLYDKCKHKVAHNAIFDIAMFRRHGSDLLGVVWDTMTAMHLLNENEDSFKLKDLAPKYLLAESDTFAELFGKNAQFADVPLDIALVYAAKDTHLTWRLYEFQREHLLKMPSIYDYYATVEIPLLYVIVALEANGYVLDLDFAKEYGDQLNKQADELLAELIELLTPYHDSDEPININSTQQVRPAMSKAIKKNLPNMDAKKTLKPLRKKHDIVDKFLSYKEITKLTGTYINALPTKQNPTTKRWHSRFNPMGTVTGRFSSGKDEEDKTNQGFNVQNQPQEARPMFVAPPGKVLVGADFKAQEIRCVAYMSGEPVLIDAFLTNRDPYAMMAATYYKRPYEEVYKNPDGSDTKERKQMKVVWLATLYGMSDFSLAEMLGTDKDSATKFKEEIFGSMPKLAAWLEANKEFVKKYGYVWADKKARKRRLPDGKLSRKKIPWGKYNDPKFEEARKHNARIGRAMRQGTNARVQGSSSIQTKVTMIRAHEECEKREGWALWASVHDELIFEIPEDFTREDIGVIRDIMLNSYPWGDVVPNGTDIEIMRRWGEGVTVDDWFANKS